MERVIATCLVILSLVACNPISEPVPQEQQQDTIVSVMPTGTVVLVTDSDEWHVQIIKEHLFYSEAAGITLSAPWAIPTRNEATILRTLDYPSSERFICEGGYTFGMPSASVSKAGTKTRYSLLGLYRRPTVIHIGF